MAKKVIREDIRINKFISDSGFCSRRDADQLIADERVTINGKPATLGSRVAEGDKVKIDGEPLQFVPMEMRERKLRRYGSSRRGNRDENNSSEGGTNSYSAHNKTRQSTGHQLANPGLESRREDSRRGEGRGRSVAKADKEVSSRGKTTATRAAVEGKQKNQSVTIHRGKSPVGGRLHSTAKRKK